MDAVRLQQWTLVAVLGAWFAFGAIFLFRRRPPEASEKIRDPMGTVGLLLQGVGFGIVWSVRRPPGSPLFDAPLPVLAGVAVLDVALAVGSVTLTLWSILSLIHI